MNSKTILSKLKQVKENLYNKINVDEIFYFSKGKKEKVIDNLLKVTRANVPFFERISIVYELLNPMGLSDILYFLYDSVYSDILKIEGAPDFYLEIEKSFGSSFGFNDKVVAKNVIYETVKYRVFTDFINLTLEKLKRRAPKVNVVKLKSVLRNAVIQKSKNVINHEKNIAVQSLKFIVKLGNTKISKIYSELVGIGRNKAHPLDARFLPIDSNIDIDVLTSFVIVLIVSRSYTVGITDKSSVVSKIYSAINSIQKNFIDEVLRKIPNSETVFNSHEVKNIIENELYFVKYAKTLYDIYEIFKDDIEKLDSSFKVSENLGAPEQKIREVLNNV